MASLPVREAILEATRNYVKPDGKVFEYGTAGVRRLAPLFVVKKDDFD
jgi:hypothetical protein